jgi:hypothetical protein
LKGDINSTEKSLYREADAHLIKTFSAFYRTRMWIAVFTEARNWTPSCGNAASCYNFRALCTDYTIKAKFSYPKHNYEIGVMIKSGLMKSTYNYALHQIKIITQKKNYLYQINIYRLKIGLELAYKEAN